MLMKMTALFLLPLLALAQLAEDETLVFFPTSAVLKGDHWMVPIHGWVFERETDGLGQRMALTAFRKALGVTREDANSATFALRASTFLVDNERGKRPTITAGFTRITAPKSGTNGHFRCELRIPKGDQAVRAKPNKWMEFNCGKVVGRSQLVMPTGISVISDIDDTIKVSQVRDKSALLTNTFLKDFETAPGMPELYAKFAALGSAFHYVSASPWQLFEPLSQFMAKSGYPRGSIQLKDFRWKDSSFFNLFANSASYKKAAVTNLLTRYPDRQFVLIGDSGEGDPELYGEIAREHPEQVLVVLIRDVAPNEDGARYDKAFAGIPRPMWLRFASPTEIDLDFL
jgi:phosphatidate phosphatase APP1